MVLSTFISCIFHSFRRWFWVSFSTWLFISQCTWLCQLVHTTACMIESSERNWDMSSLNHGHYVILFGNQVTIRLFDSYYLSKLFFVTDLSQSLLFFLLVLENKYSMFYISLFNFICKIWLILLDCWRMHSLIFHLLASLTSFAQNAFILVGLFISNLWVYCKNYMSNKKNYTYLPNSSTYSQGYYY